MEPIKSQRALASARFEIPPPQIKLGNGYRPIEIPLAEAENLLVELTEAIRAAHDYLAMNGNRRGKL